MQWAVTDRAIKIVSYLTPLDLIHLGRVSHAFRAHFLVRASKPLWKAARSGMALIPGCPGLPECPQDVSEPAYANLVFGKICEVRRVPGACRSVRAQQREGVRDDERSSGVMGTSDPYVPELPQRKVRVRFVIFGGESHPRGQCDVGTRSPTPQLSRAVVVERRARKALDDAAS
jgi:hypothetical protein